MPASRQVAEHYLKARRIPAANVVVLDLPKEEDISRPDYNAKLVVPLREALKEHKEKVKCLVATFGVPLRVGGEGPNESERTDLKKLEPRIKELDETIKSDKAAVKRLEGQAGPLAIAKAIRHQFANDFESRAEKATANWPAASVFVPRRKSGRGRQRIDAALVGQV